MANTLQIKRGDKVDLPTLSAGEFGLATDTDDLYIGNGASNIELVTEDWVTTSVGDPGFDTSVPSEQAVREALDNYTKDTDSDVSSNSWVLDQDDMSSDDATKVPTQQSVKAYVDDNAGGDSNITKFSLEGTDNITVLDNYQYIVHEYLEVGDGEITVESGGELVVISDEDTLGELSDVNLTSLSNNDLLKYNSTSENWENISHSFVETTNTDVSGNSWVIDEDDLSSDLNTKVPTQQSVKAYVDNNAGGAEYHMFHRYDANGGTTVSTSWSLMTFDTSVKLDASYYSYSSGEITIKVAGDYRVSYDATADTSAGRDHADWKLQKKPSGGSYSDVPGTYRSTYHRTSSDGRNSASCTRIINFSANDVLKLIGMSDQSSAVTTVADGLSIVIEFIE